MEFLLLLLLPSPITALVSIFAFLLFLYYFLHHRKTSTSSRRGRAPPEAGGAWPLIGHLRLLAGPEPAHRVLGSLADTYGPIFTIRIGVHRALVVSSSEIAKECFTSTNDKAFANRMKSIAVERLNYNYANFGFSPYGPFWRGMRKIIVVELLSEHRLAALTHVRVSEIKLAMNEVYKQCGVNRSSNCLVEMKRWFGDITLKLMMRIIAGKAETGEECWKAVREFFKLMGVITVADAVPFLRRLDLGGHEREMKETARKLDGMLREWLEEHKRRRKSGEVKEGEKDFIDVMLEILDGDEANKDVDADTINKATCLGLYLAGSDTSSATLTWAISLLLNNTHALKKAQDELDLHIGKQRQVEESDMKNLVYIQAIIKETMRLYPPSQVLPPRENTQEDCIVGGYHIPAGTLLFVNLYKIHHDPLLWLDPWEFRPERFLTTHTDVDVRGLNFELLPFGSGRRVCPGISFALQVLQFTLASLLHGFEVATPGGELVDMTDSFGFANAKATPLEVRLTPRLPAKLYG